jgi:hypothetical protein
LTKINNAKFELDSVQLGLRNFPIAIPNVGIKNQAWTMSIATSIGPMLRQEIAREKLGIKGKIFSIASYVLEAMAKLFCADKIVYPAHLGFSTTLYERGDIVSIIKHSNILKEKYKDRAICLRSVNGMNFRGRENKYRLIPSRVVWIIDDIENQWANRTDVKADMKIFSDYNLKVETFENAIPFHIIARCKKLYRRLYMIKYSKYNPSFGMEYLQQLVEAGILKFHILRNEDNKILAFCATQENSQYVVSPMLGYVEDTPIPLYRAIMCVPPLIALKNGVKLNNSAGAPIFKKNRGAYPIMEYILLIDDHLPFYRRFFYWLLAKILRALEGQIMKAAIK